MKNINEQIKIAEKRIAECEERRSYFAEQYRQNPEKKELYAHLCEDETKTINKIREAIIEALLNK